ARFFKSRSGANTYTAAGNVRVNGTRQTRSSARIRAGDMLTFALHGHVRVIEIIALSARRGPAVEARTLYHDHEPPENRPKTRSETKPAQRAPGSGRPTKRERRAQDAFTDKGSFQG
ncbi:MAG: RNA-binding S4 domain-containing protein, partial [Pseudomonadota bacterium]|nr:RNA-binding S4 domain-containing protein [Pseudomonadota bacterium]